MLLLNEGDGMYIYSSDTYTNMSPWTDDRFLVNSQRFPEEYIGAEELLYQLQDDFPDKFPQSWKLYGFDVHVEHIYGKRFVFTAYFKYKRHEAILHTEVPFDQIAKLLRVTYKKSAASAKILDHVKSKKFKVQRENRIKDINDEIEREKTDGR